VKSNYKIALALFAGAAMGGAAVHGLHAQAKPTASYAPHGSVSLVLSRSVVASNFSGISAEGDRATLRVTQSIVTGNEYGWGVDFCCTARVRFGPSRPIAFWWPNVAFGA
jgi:hypothetical protein